MTKWAVLLLLTLFAVKKIDFDWKGWGNGKKYGMDSGVDSVFMEPGRAVFAQGVFGRETVGFSKASRNRAGCL